VFVAVVGSVHAMPQADRTAVLFPGQGSQTDAMRETAARHRPELVSLAGEIVGADPFARVDEGTRFQQPAIFCASLAGYEALGVEPDAAAGHSLGEFGALTAAGAIDETDALVLVAARGRVMDAAACDGPPAGMLAVLKGKPGDAEGIARDHDLTVANDNAPGQVVLSGPSEALDAAARAADRAGLRAMRLPVKGSFHSPAMEPAVPALRAALDRVPVRAPRFPVFSSITARPFHDIRHELALALTHGVRWRETLLALRDAGVRRFAETGPGKVVTGLVCRTLRDVEAFAADPEATRA
jgi:[acyl-carrier-protein] S-malonyltransferase